MYIPPAPTLLSINHPVWPLMKIIFVLYLHSNTGKLFPSWDKGTFSPSRNFQNVLFCKWDREVSVLRLLAETVLEFWSAWMETGKLSVTHPCNLRCMLLAIVKSKHHEEPGSGEMSSYCEVHQKAEKVSFSNAFRYLPQHRRCLTVCGFNFFN